MDNDFILFKLSWMDLEVRQKLPSEFGVIVSFPYLIRTLSSILLYF